MTHHQHVGDRDCDTGWEHDFHSRTLETHYSQQLLRADSKGHRELRQLWSAGLHVHSWALHASQARFLWENCSKVSIFLSRFSNGAPPRQANKVKLYHTAQMNSPPTPLMVYNCQSVFTLTGEGTPKKFLWVTPMSYIEFVETWRDRKEQAACPCSRDGHAQGLLDRRCSSRNKWGRVHRAVHLQALHPVASLAKLYMHRPETCNQQAHGEF